MVDVGEHQEKGRDRGEENEAVSKYFCGAVTFNSMLSAECSDCSQTSASSTHTTMLVGIKREVREIADRIGGNQVVGSTTIMWKRPGVSRGDLV